MSIHLQVLIILMLNGIMYKDFYHCRFLIIIIKKVGARQALAISRVAFAGIFTTENGIITRCAMAFGSVADTVLRFRDLEALFVGKSIAEAKSLRSQFIASYDQAIVPIRGRVSAEYRKSVCMNLLDDFLNQNGI